MKVFKFLSVILSVLPLIVSAQKIQLVNSGEVIKKALVLYDSAKYKTALTQLEVVSRSDTNYVYSLYAKAITCEADSQYHQAIKYCQEGLALKEQRDYEPDLYNTYGNVLNAMGKHDEAIKVFDAAIAKYPAYSYLYYNKGVAYLESYRPADAELLFQKTLLINPYMYSAHFQLSIAALRQGKIVPGFLGLIGYLLVNPEGKYWSNSIKILSAISHGTDEIMEYKNKRTIEPGEDYQTVEEILLSKIALDNAYKPTISLDDPISRQIQVVFEKLDFDKNDNDFYMQYYMPYYKKLFSDGRFELFINHIFSGTDVKSINAYNKQKSKELEQLVNDAADYFNLIRATRELTYSKRDSVKERYFFEDGKLIGKGIATADGKNLTGKWESYYAPGNIKNRGSFDATGRRTGDWLFYFFNGALKTKQHDANGKLEGEQIYYFNNGNLSSSEHYANGLAEGLVTEYYYGGGLKTITNYKLDKKSGEQKEYYTNGNLRLLASYFNDVLNGPYTNYYNNGHKKEVTTYANGKVDGPYKFYYESGPLSYEGLYKDDKAEGAWNYYYEDGHPKEKRNFVDDLAEGTHEEYYENGQISASYTMLKGKINGEANYFYKDGKPLSKYTYENGIIRSAAFFDPAGKQLSAAQLNGSNVGIISWSEEGFKNGHYFYGDKGMLEGPDTIYFPSGKMSQVLGYKDDELEGPSVTYYANGKVKSQINMSAGKQDGYYTSYYTNGQVQTEGWMQDDEAEGQWNNYDELGRLTTVSNYLDGDLDGFRVSYTPDGKKTMEEKYYKGWLLGLSQFDKGENVIGVDSFPKCSGRYKLVYPNGKTLAEMNYVNGEYNGEYKLYYFDGSPETVCYYRMGSLDSTYTTWYYGGAKDTEGHYLWGSKTGVWKSYQEDGSLLSTTEYANDMLNGVKIDYDQGVKNHISIYKDDELQGPVKRYDIDGTLAYQVNFVNGRAMSYSYLGADNKMVPEIPIAFVNGSLKTVYPNGKVSRECVYGEGLKNGSDADYYSNGQLRSIDTTAYNISEGASRQYYSNGKPRYEYRYVTDNATGICKEYGKNGNLIKEISFDNGQYNGPTKYYDENGKLIKTLVYDYGTLISVKNEK